MSNPIRPDLKTEIIPIIFLVLSIVLSFYFFQNFPVKVATHWNTHGQPDGYTGKTFAAFFFPVLNVGIYLLMLLIPLADPKKQNYKYFRHIYHIIKGALVVFMTVIYFIISLNALNYNLPVNILVPIGVGILFVILGYYLKDVKPNWFMGIRTPWTLSSDRVWAKTHKFGSKVFITCGLLIILASIFPDWFPWFMGLMMAMVAGVIIYSFVIYKKQ